MKNAPSLRKMTGPPLWRDERVLRAIAQLVFLVLILAALGYFWGNMQDNMRRQGLSLSFSFLRTTSGFDIGENLVPYSRNSTFAQAFLVGLVNTLLVSFLGVVAATLLGIFFGVARLSTNFLIQQIAKVYIEFLRNIPLLVFLIFLYTGFFIQLPRVREAITLPGPTFLSNRGVVIPWGTPTETFDGYLWALGGAALLGILVTTGLNIYGRRVGRAPLSLAWGLSAFLLVAVLGWLLMPTAPLAFSRPELQGLRIAGGLTMSPEFMALLTGLAVYTSAFIADVVRAGIQAIPRGQVEAARSVGLSPMLTLRLIVFPQAMRVIVPPLTSQYLNLTKNSSLAVAIGYPELFHVSGTVLNQSGRAVEVITIAMAIYLAISLLTSLFMNWYNNRVRLVER